MKRNHPLPTQLMKLGLAASSWAVSSLLAAAPTQTSTTEVNKSTLEKVRDVLMLRVDTQYFGPSLGDPSAEVPSATAYKSGDRQNMDTFLHAFFKPGKDWLVGPSLHMTVFPLGGKKGEVARLLDPVLRIQKNNVYNKDGWNLTLDGRFEPGVTGGFADGSRFFRARASQALNYAIPNSRWTVGTYSFVRASWFPSGNNTNTNLEYYLAPNTSFQITPTLAATVWVDALILSHSVGESNPLAISSDWMDIEPGISWDIAPGINFNPYINIYPGKLDINNTSLGFIFSARIL